MWAIIDTFVYRYLEFAMFKVCRELGTILLERIFRVSDNSVNVRSSILSKFKNLIKCQNRKNYLLNRVLVKVKMRKIRKGNLKIKIYFPIRLDYLPINFELKH